MASPDRSAPAKAACPNIPHCELFPLIAKPGFLRVWQINYCEADYSACARYQRKSCGDKVPLTLLPNGQELASLAKKDGKG